MITRARTLGARLEHLGLGLRAGGQSFVALALGAGGVLVALGGDPVQALALAAAALLMGALARRSWEKARGARRAARSRAALRRSLRPLRAAGWRIEESLRWPGGGRLDFLAVAPGGPLAFALVASPHRAGRALDRAQELAGWLSIDARPCIPVVAVERLDHGERDDRGVLVVSTRGAGEALADAEAGFHRALRPEAGAAA